MPLLQYHPSCACVGYVRPTNLGLSDSPNGGEEKKTKDSWTTRAREARIERNELTDRDRLTGRASDPPLQSRARPPKREYHFLLGSDVHFRWMLGGLCDIFLGGKYLQLLFDEFFKKFGIR